jgi:O-antigen/teichoic acid export membrane protein
VQVIAALILIPQFGILGAAVSTTLAALVGTVLSLDYVNKKHGISMQASTITRILIGLVLIFILWFILSKFLAFKGLWLLFEYAVLFGAYSFFMLFSGESEKDDWERIYNLLPKPISDFTKEFVHKFIPMREVVS